jgi:hypothetical protein
MRRIAAGALLSFILTPPALAQSGNQLWRFTGNVMGGYTKISGSSLFDYSSVLNNLMASLAYSRWSQKSSMYISGWTSHSFLRNVRLHSFGFSGNHFSALTPRSRLSFAGGYGDGLSLSGLLRNGVFTLENDFRSAYAATWFGHDFSDKTTASANFNFNWFRYKLEGTLDGSQFVMGLPTSEQTLDPQLPTEIPSAEIPETVPLDAYTFALNILATEGLRFRDFAAYNYQLRGNISHAFTTRTNASFIASYRWLDLDPPRLGGGGDLGLTARFGHRFSDRLSLTPTYTFRRNTAVVPHINSHTGSAALQYRLTRRVSVNGFFGLTHFSFDGPTDSRTSLIGGGGLSANYTRTSFNINYSHRFDQSLGFGRNLNTDVFNAGLSQLLTNRMQLRGYGGFRYSRDTLDDTFNFTVALVGVDWVYVFHPKMSISAGYLYRYIDWEVFGYRTHLFSISFSFGARWK